MYKPKLYLINQMDKTKGNAKTLKKILQAVEQYRHSKYLFRLNVKTSRNNNEDNSLYFIRY